MKSWSTILATALLAGTMLSGPPAEAAPSTSDRQGYYEDAVVRYAARDYKAALIQLKNALQENPTNLSARLLLGRVHLMLNDPQAAEKELETAQRLGGDDEIIIAPLAEAYLGQRKFKTLLDRLQSGNRTPRTEATVRAARGTANYELLRFDQATDDFNAARDLAPDDPRPLLGLARVQIQQGNFKAAEPYVDQAIAIAPNLHDAWYVKGELQRATHRFEEAVTSYTRAISLVEGHIPARISRAGVLVELDRLDEAEQDLLYVREIEALDAQASYLLYVIRSRKGDRPGAAEALNEAEVMLRQLDQDLVRTHGPLLLLAGVVSAASGKINEATFYLGEYLQRAPHHLPSRKLLAQIYLRKGQPQLTLQTLAPVMQDGDGTDWRILAMAAAANQDLQRYDDAAALFEKALKLVPENSGIRTQLALTQIARGQSGEAIDVLETATAEDPSADRPAALLGLLHLRRQEYEAALKIADQLLAAKPENLLAFNLKGGALLGLGDRDGARKAFRQALAIDPTYRPVIGNIARLDIEDGRVEEARRLYQGMLARNAFDTAPMKALADLALADKKYDEAIKLLEKVAATDRQDIANRIKLIQVQQIAGRRERVQYLLRELKDENQSNLPVLEAVGRMELQLGEKEKAVRTFQSMANLRPDAHEELTRIADLQVLAGDTTGAYNTLKRAVWVKPEHLPAQSALIRLEINSGRIDDAEQRAKVMRLSFPTSDFPDRMMGDVMMSARRYEEAVAAYTVAIGKDDNYVNALRLHLAVRAEKNPEVALKILTDWQKRHPEDARLDGSLAAAYMSAGHDRKATAAFEKLLKARPNDPALLNNLAWLYHKAGDDRALAYAENAYKRAPQNPAVIDTLGWILVQRGDAARGLTLLRDAHTRAALDLTIRYHMAVALVRLGRAEEAKAHLQELLRSTDPTVKAQADSLMQQIGG